MRRFFFLAGAFVCSATCIALFWWPEPQSVRAYFFDVGQGDASLLVSPSGKQIVIDGGPNTQLLEHLGDTMPFFDRTIELLVLSHAHADHLTALPDLLRRYKVEAVLMSGAQYSNSRYDAMNALIAEKHIPIIKADPDHDLDMGDGLTLDVIWPRESAYGKEWDELNDSSVTLRALYGSSAILFTGDIEIDAERAIIASGEDLRADILKVSHHGSDTSSTSAFLAKVQPKIAVISAGKDNSYGHPDPLTMKKFADLGIETHVTFEEGTVMLEL